MMEKMCVHICIEIEELMRELLQRSSYMAVSLRPAEPVVEGWSDRWILTDDELPWVRDRMQEAYDRINGVLSAYLAKENVETGEKDVFYFILVLPKEMLPGSDGIVKRAIREALLSYVLSCWYFDRLPEKAAYQLAQLEENLNLLRARLNRRTKPIRRPVRP